MRAGLVVVGLAQSQQEAGALVRELGLRGGPAPTRILLKADGMRGQALWEFLCAGADSYWFESRGAPLADAANQLALEQNTWSDLNRSLDELERSLAQPRKQ